MKNSPISTKARIVIFTAAAVAAIFVSLWFMSSMQPGLAASNQHQASPPDLTANIPANTAEPEEMGDKAMPEQLPAISPEMAAAIRQMSNHSTEGLKETVNPDGSITLHHEDRFQSVIAGVKGPDGKIYIRHGEEFLQNVKTR